MVTSEATRLFQHCNITSRGGLSKSPALVKNYEQWIRLNKETVREFLHTCILFF